MKIQTLEVLKQHTEKLIDLELSIRTMCKELVNLQNRIAILESSTLTEVCNKQIK